LAEKIMDKIEHLDVDRAVDTLETAGIFVQEEFLDSNTLSRVREEYEQLFSQSITGVTLGDHPPGRMATIETGATDEKGPNTILEIFLSNAFRTVAERYMPKNSVFNDRILATHEFRSGPTTDTHFDSVRTLKFFIYLLDTDEGNGAFRYAHGTHTSNSSYRHRFLQNGGHLLDLQNIPSAAEPINLVPICAPAGSLLIFDTDGFHAGGVIGDDSRERKVLRARSVFSGQPRLHPRRFSPMWFRRRFNVLPPNPPFDIPGRARTGGSARMDAG
jgi:ectoine hydroxylase-related dioxygenase (phytanoyl-CoA dioxygenase family)